MKNLTITELKRTADKYSVFAWLVIEADRRGQTAGMSAMGSADRFYEACDELRRRGVNPRKIYGIG